MTFKDFLCQIIGEHKAGLRTRHRRSVPISEGTMNNYRNFVKVMERFEKETGKVYELDEIDMRFQRRMTAWCHERGFMCNTIKKMMTITRTVMNVAVREHYCTNTEFRLPEFIPMAEEREVTILSPEMMSEMMKKSLTGKLEEVRDLFVVGYLTGQRFSDYSRITSDMYEEIEGRRFLRIIQRKTENEVYVPLDWRVDKIVKRYGGRLPKMGLSEFNLRLKELVKEMKWEVVGNVTSHTARRSFATNAYAAGIPLASIMCITGHSREEHLRKYLHLKTEVMAVQAAKDLYG